MLQGFWGACQSSAVASAPGKQDWGSGLRGQTPPPCPVGNAEVLQARAPVPRSQACSCSRFGAGKGPGMCLGTLGTHVEEGAFPFTRDP